MENRKSKSFAEKHGSAAKPDDMIKDEIGNRVENDELPCAVAFRIAKDLNVSPGEVGRTADLLNVRLMKCQMGLFGYKPVSKIIKPNRNEDRALKDAIRDALANNRLPCKSAWEIASRFDVPKMTVSGVCEDMKIKMRPCQLGAF